MTREMTKQEELAAKLAASKINPSFQPEVMAEIEAEPHDEHGCYGSKCKCGGKCKCGKCKCGKCNCGHG